MTTKTKRKPGRPRKVTEETKVTMSIENQSLENAKLKTMRVKPKREKIVFMAMKFVPTVVKNPVIVTTKKGFRVTGYSEDGQPLSAIVSKDRALRSIENGSAKQGW